MKVFFVVLFFTSVAISSQIAFSQASYGSLNATRMGIAKIHAEGLNKIKGDLIKDFAFSSTGYTFNIDYIGTGLAKTNSSDYYLDFFASKSITYSEDSDLKGVNLSQGLKRFIGLNFRCIHLADRNENHRSNELTARDYPRSIYKTTVTLPNNSKVQTVQYEFVACMQFDRSGLDLENSVQCQVIPVEKINALIEKMV